jgi:uncharacterized protein
MAAPKLRDVRKLADSRTVFELDIPLRELPQFPAGYLADGGQVHARMSFGREQGYAMAQVALQTELSGTCQRCLGALRVRIETNSPVLIVESEQEADGAPPGWETFLAPEGRLIFAALAAEELLLAVPIVPLHEEASQCPPLAQQIGVAAAEAGRSAVSIEPAPHAQPSGAGSAGDRVGQEQAVVRPFADLRALLERSGKRE